MSHGLGDMLTVCQGTCRQSRKAEIHTLLQRRYWRDETLAATLTQSSICISLIKERKKKKKKVTGSWRRAGWSGCSQERHSQKWVRLSSLGTCRFAPGSVCPGTQPTLLPTCDVPMQAAASMWGLWDLALSCPGKVRFWGSVLQQGGILHRTAVIYRHICDPLNSEMDV